MCLLCMIRFSVQHNIFIYFMKLALPLAFQQNTIEFVKSMSNDFFFQKVITHDTIIPMHERFDIEKMSRKQKLECISRIILDKELDSLILLYELQHIKISDYVEDLNILAKFAKKELNRYQHYAGGNNFDDDEWVICDKNTSNCRYNIRDNMRVLYNSMNTTRLFDADTMFFLNKMTQHLQKFTKTIEVDYNVSEDETHDIIWVAIFFEKKIVEDIDDKSV